MRFARPAIYSAFILAAVLYALQLFTPLRLTTDGIMYLSLADVAAHQGVRVAWHQPFAFPRGYPLFISIFMKAGIFSSTTLVFVNLILFAAGLRFNYKTMRAIGFEQKLSLVACLLTVLCFAAVKFITQGLSDFLLFALAACTCWLLTRDGPEKWLSILSAACAVEVRLIGLALLVPIAIAMWPTLKKHPALLTAGAVLGTAAAAAGAFAGYRYFQANVSHVQSDGLWRFAGKSLLYHAQDFGELTVNAPLSKLPSSTHVAVLIVGGLVLALFLVGLVEMWRCCKWIGGYLIACCALILPWPFTDPRFWLPALPFVVCAVYLAVRRLWSGMPDPIVAVYIVLFSLAGFMALAYSTRLTFSGPNFAYRYGDGTLTATYLTRCSAGTDPNERAQHALRLLQSYEWHCGNSQ